MTTTNDDDVLHTVIERARALHRTRRFVFCCTENEGRLCLAAVYEGIRETGSSRR